MKISLTQWITGVLLFMSISLNAATAQQQEQQALNQLALDTFKQQDKVSVLTNKYLTDKYTITFGQVNMAGVVNLFYPGPKRDIQRIQIL
jgi:hypothetical protein